MITEFENPDVEFLIIDGNYLELGTDILFESEFMTTVELNEWANDNVSVPKIRTGYKLAKPLPFCCSFCQQGEQADHF